MTDSDRSPAGYAKRAREATHSYIVELLADNDRLRRQIASLESEGTRLREERLGLQEKALALREELDRYLEERRRMLSKLSEAEAENQRFAGRFAEVEEHNNNLAHLYVASYQLHATVERSEVLTALQEIIINLIGSEDFVILERSSTRGGLSVVASSGLGRARAGGLDLESGPIGRALASGELVLADEDPPHSADEMVASIPMKLGKEIHGVIAIFRLLDHKGGLAPLDFELFDLLASHAASSLYASRLHGQMSSRDEVVA